MSANPEQGEVDIEIAGDVYTLKLSMRAAKSVQQRTKKTVGELFMAAQRLDYDAISELMSALLQHHHGDQFKKVSEVDALLDRAGGPKVFFDYCEAIQSIEPAGEAPGVEGAERNPPVAQGGTGEGSVSQLAVPA